MRAATKKPIKPPKHPHLRSLLGNFGKHKVTIKPIKGVKKAEIKNDHPKPMRRCEPMMPTIAARSESVSNPKISANIDIMITVFTICRKDN